MSLPDPGELADSDGHGEPARRLSVAEVELSGELKPFTFSQIVSKSCLLTFVNSVSEAAPCIATTPSSSKEKFSLLI